MVIQIKPLSDLEQFAGAKPLKVFLSGSIEMGTAPNWQQEVFTKLGGVDLILFNPRRDDWDTKWGKDKVSEQITWELRGLELADVVAVHLEPTTKSPITLLELGLYARLNPGKLIVHCPEEFYRSTNVGMVCLRYNVQQVATLDELIEKIRVRANE